MKVPGGGENGEKAWAKRKDQIIFTLGIVGVIFEAIVVPILGPLMGVEFRIEVLLFFGGILGVPLARFGDRK